MKTPQKGFTLIELLVVISILSVLAAIAIPYYWSNRIKAFNSTAEADIANFRIFLELVYADHKHYPLIERNMSTGLVTFTVPEDLSDSVSFLTSVKVYIGYKTDSHRITYTAMAKHIDGDSYYGVDSDSPLLFYIKNRTFVGRIGDVSLPDPHLGVLDFDSNWNAR